MQSLNPTGKELKLHHRRVSVGKVLLIIIGGVTAFSMLLPFMWMVFSSFKPLEEVFIQPPKLLPENPTFEKYQYIWDQANFPLAIWNSLYIAVLVTAGTLLTSAMAAYAFARIKFTGNGGLFMTFLATMMVPTQLTIIPTFIMMSKVGLVDTHWALILPPIFFNAFGVFLLRQYVRGIPLELEEAAAMDGASRVGIFFRIIMPLLRSPLTALGIFTFLNQWNSFFYPLIFLNTSPKFTLPLVVAQFKGTYSSDWTAIMAASSVSAMPLLIMFIFAQRQIVEGIALSGSKT